MAHLKLTKTRIQSGRYEAELTSDEDSASPDIGAYHMGVALDGLTVARDPDRSHSWHVTFAVPAELLMDGVQTITFKDHDSDEILDSFHLLAGDPLSQDLRSEIDLLRAELDMLKKAFRRHCRETK